MSASLPEGVPPHSNRLRAAQPASRDRFECSTHGPGGHGRCDVESEQREQETDDWEAFVADEHRGMHLMHLIITAGHPTPPCFPPLHSPSWAAAEE